MIWDQCTSQEIGAADKERVVILPLAATEQHGPHLPLATDRLIVEGICRALETCAPEQVLILPCPPVGYSAHHREFPGTLSVAHEVLIAMAAEVVGCAIEDGFQKVLILNGHGGNIALGNVLLEQLGERHRHARFVFTSWWQAAGKALAEISETGPGGTGHACEFETSVMQHLHPELVRTDRIAPGANVPTFAWAESDMLRGAAARLHRSFGQMTGNGVFGDPTRASAEKGARILDAVVRSLLPVIQDLLNDRGCECDTV